METKDKKENVFMTKLYLDGKLHSVVKYLITEEMKKFLLSGEANAQIVFTKKIKNDTEKSVKNKVTIGK